VSSIHNLRIHHAVVDRGFLDHLKRPEHRWKDSNEVDDVDWNDFSPDRDKWWTVMHAVMNLRFS
jgi:hypothetical protein